MQCRGVARGWAGGGTEPPWNLTDQLTLFEPGWADFAPQTTASPPPRIQKAIYISAMQWLKTFLKSQPQS